MKGLIIKGVGGFYYVETDAGDVLQAKGRGLFKKDKFLLMVGDRVEVEEGKGEEDDALIVAVEERRNYFDRPPIANVDKLICVVSMSKPKVNFLILDKLLAAAESKGAKAMVCINKSDEGNVAEGEAIRGIYDGIYPTVLVSGIERSNLNSIREFIGRDTAALVGPSGVGKSTLINALIPDANMDTGEISDKTLRGKHTTRHVEIFHLDNGYLFDTPGFTSLYGEFNEEHDVARGFPEIAVAAGECRYDDCLHLAEPECNVIRKVEAGEISRPRYESYMAMIEEVRGKKKY